MNELRVDTKDYGTIRLGQKLLGTQKEYFKQIVKGLEDDIHEYWILKGRQVAITTATLALDLYWPFTHPGMGCTLVADEEGNSKMFRDTLTNYTKNLPPAYNIPCTSNNKYGMNFANRSSLIFQIAGRKKGNDRLGQGKAITFLHGTEVASWGSEEGLASLQSSLAQKNEERLFIFESTASGFNMFYDNYQTAKKSKVAKAIFIGWWLHEGYSIHRDDPRYRQYWDGKLTGEEKDWSREVFKLYGVRISAEQIAWWRWMGAEKVLDESLLYQEFPPTEEFAFVMSGTNFFSNGRCTEAMRDAIKLEPETWRFDFGLDFKDTGLIESNEAMCNLMIWEQPNPRGWYVIGADPAYGSSAWKDRFCINVFRCYANGLDQVAEFCTDDLNPYQFAWVLAYLGGLYSNSVVNLETNGPGQAVINELNNLKRQAAMMAGGTSGNLSDVLGNMRQYLWRKNDSLSGPGGTTIGWLTTGASKERAYTYVKDYFERRMLNVWSVECLNEMKNIVRDLDSGTIEAFGRNKDDRAMTVALACAAYAEQVQPILISMGETREVAQAVEEKEPEEMRVESALAASYLRQYVLGK